MLTVVLIKIIKPGLLTSQRILIFNIRGVTEWLWSKGVLDNVKKWGNSKFWFWSGARPWGANHFGSREHLRQCQKLRKTILIFILIRSATPEESQRWRTASPSATQCSRRPGLFCPCLWISQSVIRFSDVCNKHRQYFKFFAKNDFWTMFQSSCPKWLLTRNKEMPCLNCRLIEMGEMACYQVVPA